MSETSDLLEQTSVNLEEVIFHLQDVQDRLRMARTSLLNFRIRLALDTLDSGNLVPLPASANLLDIFSLYISGINLKEEEI